MIGRYFLLFLGLISLFWIGYVGLDLLDKKDQFSPTQIFGENDGRVLVLNRFDECSLDQLKFTPTPESTEFYDAIRPSLEDIRRLILSENQNHMLIENNDNWSKNKIVHFFKKANLKVDFVNRHTFVCGKFKGKYNHSVIYLSASGIKEPDLMGDNWMNIDFKSSASIISFKNKKYSISDIYVKQDNIVQYISKDAKIKFGNEIDDQQIFSVAIPNDISDYHFYEKEYYACFDKTFKKSPFYQWIESGFVQFTYKNDLVLVSDFIAGQDPLLILNEQLDSHENSEKEAYFGNLKLMKNFPQQQGFYLKIMEGFVVMSSSKIACEQVVADYKLGNTLAMKKENLIKFYQNLPRKVSERFISENSTYTRTKYKEKLLETYLDKGGGFKIEEKDQQRQESENKTVSMYVGQHIQDFVVLNGTGNIVVLSRDGSFQIFSSGKSIFKKKLGTEAVGNIQQVDALLNGEKQLMCASKNQIHLFNKSGGEVVGYPIQLVKSAVSQVTYYRWKGDGYFVCANEDNELQIYSTNGKLVNTFKTGLKNISKPVEVWLSRNILLAGVRNDKECVLYTIDKKKEYRRFAINDESFSVKTNNELVQFYLNGNQLNRTDQKGIHKELARISQGEILTIKKELSTPTIVVKSNSTLSLLNYQGNIYSTITLPFSEIEDVEVANSPQGVSYIGVVDGLNNNVYIFNVNGKQVVQKSLEGKSLVKITWSTSEEMIITTVVDDYIIQYVQNSQ